MSHIFIVPVVLLNSLYFIMAEEIANILTLALLIFGVYIIIYIRSSLRRKDILNIVKYNNRVYFNLSDDIFFSVEIMKNSVFDEVTLLTIEKKVLTVKEVISRVEFINFYDENLYNRLNSLLHEG